MKKSLIMVLGLVVMAGVALADATQNINMTVNLQAWYNLSFSGSSLTFTDVAPATYSASPATKSIAANEGAISVDAFAVIKSSQTLNLTVKANGDLTDGTNNIGIGAITWAATGSGYAAGTMNKTTAQSAGSWTSSILHYHSGTFTYSFLRDYTSQAPGTYTASATYTLSVV